LLLEIAICWYFFCLSGSLFSSGNYKNHHWQKHKLPLPLFEAWVLFVYNIKFSFSPDDFAIGAALFYGCPYFHFIIAFCF